MAVAEVRHPVMSSFVSLFPATTMLVAIGFVPQYRRWPLRYSAWGRHTTGVCRWRTAGLWQVRIGKTTTPGLYLPHGSR